MEISDKLLDLVNMLHYPCMVIDSDDIIIYYNETLQQKYAPAKDSILNMKLSDVIPGYYDIKKMDFKASQTPCCPALMKLSGFSHEVYVSVTPLNGFDDYYLMGLYDMECEGSRPVVKTAHKEILIDNFDFFSYFTHELRTPINAILGYAAIGLDSITDPEQVKNLQIMKNSSKYLLHTVDNFLDFAKILKGTFTISPIKFLFINTLNYTYKLFKIQAADKKIDYRIMIDENVPNIIFGDEQRISQMLINILTNAFKYTHKNGTILIRCQYDNEHLIISVSDTGIGIPDNKLQTIFKPFEQLENSTKSVSGAGLGLTITKKLIELMNGTINVESTVGQGTTFTISLSLDENHYENDDKDETGKKGNMEILENGDIVEEWLTRHQELKNFKSVILEGISDLPDKITELQFAIMNNDQQDIIHLSHKLKGFAGCYGFDEIYTLAEEIYEEIQGVNYDLDSIVEQNNQLIRLVRGIPAKYFQKGNIFKEEKPVTDVQMIMPLDKLRVLVVDDNTQNLVLIRKFLESISIHCDIAGSGSEALSFLGNKPYHLVLMDLKMPEMDGFETVSLIRKNERFTGLYVIALTAERYDDVDELKSKGFDDYMLKKLDKDDFINKIAALLPDSE